MTESSSDNRKVDKRTALSMWDSSAVPTGLKKKRPEEEEDGENGVMKFTVITRRGHKQQAHQLAVPTSSTLAVHTKSAQLRDEAEHAQLKRLVLNYEQREGEAMQGNAFKLRESG